MRGVDVRAFRLAVGPARPADAEAFRRWNPAPAESLDDVVFGPRYEPGAVGVLDAEQEVSPVPAGEEGIVQGGPNTAHVERAGGTGGKADADAAGIHGLRRYVGESAGFVCKTSRF